MTTNPVSLPPPAGVTPIPPEVLEHPKVQAAIAEAATADKTAAKVATTGVVNPLAKYGIDLRPPGLLQQAMITRVLLSCPMRVVPAKDGKGKPELQPSCPTIYQPFIWVFTLGAPEETIFAAMERLEAGGLKAFMADVQRWFDSLNIPPTASGEVLSAMTGCFELAAAALRVAAPAVGDEEKKTPALTRLDGSSGSPTSSPASTTGLSPSSGEKSRSGG
jgi:hypothetical protein